MYRSLALNTCILWAEFIQSTTSRYFAITTMVISTSRPDRQLLPQQKQQKIAKKRTIMTVLVGATFALEVSSQHFDKTPKNTSILTGRRWLDELLAGHPICFYDNLGMNKHVFCALVSELGTTAGLYDTRWVSAEEQIAIFLYLAVTGVAQCHLKERFQRSPDTLSK